MSEQARQERSARQIWARPQGSHDQVVKLLRFGLPAAIGALAVFLVFAPIANPNGDVSFVLAKDSVSMAAERMRVTAATYRGEDSKGRPFEIKAGSAVQRSSQDPVVKLSDLMARIQSNADTVLTLVANYLNLSQIEAAKKWILGIVEEPEIGQIYSGKVVNIVDFGAFVNFMGGKDGLVHVSEMKNERVERPTDVVSEGMDVKVKVLEIDQRGKVRLSMRVVDQETGEELEDTRPPREPRDDRGPRGEGRGDRGPRRDGGDRGGRDRDRGGRDRDRGPRREGGERGDRGPRRERSDDGPVDEGHLPGFLKAD